MAKTTPGRTPDRRRFPRVQISGELHGQLGLFRTPVVILDISENGFAVESPVPFTPEQVYRVHFSSPQRAHPMLEAINVHCLQVETNGSESVYFAGFQFGANVPAAA